MFDIGRHRCVLFDVDGTIAETEGQAHLPAFNHALKEAGLGWRWTTHDYQRLLKTTGGLERLLRYAEETGNDPDALRPMLTEVHKAKNAHFATILASGAVQPREGFADLVRQLADLGITWGVVTTTSRANWDALWRYSLAPFNLPSPQVVIVGEDVRLKKPAAEAYLLALENLRLPTEYCCAIEDSRNGLQAAMGAGLEVAIVRSQFFGDEEFGGASVVVNELSELVQQLEQRSSLIPVDSV